MIFSGNVPGDEDLRCFPLDESIYCKPIESKIKRLLSATSAQNPYKAHKRGDRSISSDKITWKDIFSSICWFCQENIKLREFHFKFIDRVIVTKKDSDCIYCGEADSIDHSFINCQFTKSFTQEVLQLTIKKLSGIL